MKYSKENDFIEKLFGNRPVDISYNIVKNPCYGNLGLAKVGHIKFSGEDCVG